LLLFSRRQQSNPERVNLDTLIEGLLKMLRRLLGEHIETAFEKSAEPPWIQGDAGMLEQVVMNLCVNARDAMPKGGRMKLTTRCANLGPMEAQLHPDACVGPYVCLSVSDNGCGMDPETLGHIFEPFFTTKEPTKGTGLGLATVHGIVKQHKGWVEVESAPGQGTTFRVFLPAADPPNTAGRSLSRKRLHGGSETILLVEDDDQVRHLVRMTLKLCGYGVIEARTGLEALKMWDSQGGRVSLLLTDMVMPEGVTGLELARRFRQLQPGLKTIIISGYSADLLQEEEQLPPGTRYLPKPIDAQVLINCVRDHLDKKD